MKITRALPLVLGSLTALSLAVQETERNDKKPVDRPPTERRGLQVPEDALPESVGNRDVGALDVFGRRIRAPRNTLVDRIKGGWVLTQLDLENSRKGGRRATGFMIVGENYLSIEIHAFWNGTPKQTEYDLHQSFTAEYVLDATGRLTCRTMIGANLDEQTGLLLWDRAGRPREFRVEETERELVLRWKGAKNRMVFRPRSPQMRGATDIFGRRKVIEGDAATLDRDIYGRPVPDQTGETDIFGRKKPLEDPEGTGGTGGTSGDDGAGGR